MSGERPVDASKRERPLRPDRWQRRWLLRHFPSSDDSALAAVSGLSVATVREELSRLGAGRTAADLRRIERSGGALPPSVPTPRAWRERLLALESRPMQRLDCWLLLLLGLVSLGLYASTAAREVTGEDAGELLAAAWTLGVPHPPGYPLWTLLSWAAAHGLPFGTIPWRVALIGSALPAALANVVFIGIALKTLRSRWAATIAAGVFAVSLTHWSQAVIPEVYGLNTLLIAAMALLVLRLREQPSTGRLFALAAVSGLSLTNHPTAAPVAALAAAGALLIAPRLVLRPKVALGAVLAGLLPLALYLYLPWASQRDPYLDWGNPESAEALLAHVTRAQYAGVETEATAAGGDYGSYLRRLGILGNAALWQLGGPWVLLLGAIGAVRLMVKQTGPWILLCGIGWLCSIGVTRFSQYSFDKEHVYANQIFFIPAWMTLAWLVGGGLDGLFRFTTRPHRALRAAALTATSALLLLPPVWAHHGRVDRSDSRLIAEYGRALLDTMEPGALYLPASDHSTFVVLYRQGVLGERPDVVVADKYGRLDPAVIASAVPLGVQAEIARRPLNERRDALEAALMAHWPGPVYLAGQRDMADLPGRTLEPCGPLFRVMDGPQAAAWWGRSAAIADPGLASPLIDSQANAALSIAASDPKEEGGASGAGALGSDAPGLRIWSELPAPAALDLDDEAELLDFTAQMVASDLHAMAGLALMEAGLVEEAVQRFSRIAGDLAPQKQTFNNIGAALAEAGRHDLSLQYLERALAEDPGYLLALRNAVSVHQAQGDLPAAIARLSTLVEQHPDARLDRFKLARLLARHGDPRGALAQYEVLATQDWSDPLPWREAGDLLARIGDGDKALAAYGESLQRDRHQRDVAAAMERLRSGRPQAAVELEAAGLAAAVDPAEAAGLAALRVALEGPQTGGPPQPALPDGLNALAAALPAAPDPRMTALPSPPDPVASISVAFVGPGPGGGP